jgi:hypothetical protein
MRKAKTLSLAKHAMPQYKFYLLDRNDVVITVRDFAGSDDVAALAEAEKLRRSHTIEICCGDRRAGWLEKIYAPRRPKISVARPDRQ